MPLTPPRRAALDLLATWTSERYFRTFRVSDEDAAPFDAILTQRERRVGVTIGALWEPDAAPAGADDLAEALTADLMTDRAIEPGAYVVWVPPKAALPVAEPAFSSLRVSLAKGLAGLAPGDRREVRIPVTVHLAKIQNDGAYMSVTGGLAPEWTTLSEGLPGAYHLDARDLCRLPEQEAEVAIIVSLVRDQAAMLQPEQVTTVAVHDTWVVSRLSASAPEGVTVIAAPPDLDPLEGAPVRRMLRRHVQRGIEARAAAEAAGIPLDLHALAVIGAVTHLKEELATAALRGMNPAAYGGIDLIAIAGDGAMRQVLQPRALPWEATR